MTELEYQEINALLAVPKKIAIIPHRSPDGDAMGSTLAMYHFLNKLGHDAFVVAPNEFPDFLAWLPGSSSVLIFEKNKESVAAELEKADIVFTLDFNALHRTGEMEHTLARLKALFIMIDHHQWPNDYAKYTYSDTNFGSTCEMVYHFISGLNRHDVLDTTIATCIYCGIVTDSGSFRFPSVTSNTHRIVAHLIDLGVQNGQVHSDIYDSNSFESRQLLGKALVNLVLLPGGKAAYITLTQSELDQYHYMKGDTEGIVNYGLSIKGVQFAAIFIENRDEGLIKASFRSKGDFDVNVFARNHFNGGGHVNAAGGKSHETMSETVHKFVGLVSQLSL
ncbi:DHH family phosphoesterase [Flavobacterium silvaticum]|uniref:Bifunctional oligoribonuclease/PAP phosphatase NrnA n=1 Tax=Flavobacterium silvaticum TaxID=1852020 RepID=A0A972FTS8_9FLAO|nr:bifunctional oligoribonuclease/PAP phosphatase NrnA [Flavobacterium silvaticum]NMH27862.1 bifunctional oligoribonuclease/PAP phosphatase NrnA [Flavobacterium silvaticum]